MQNKPAKASFVKIAVKRKAVRYHNSKGLLPLCVCLLCQIPILPFAPAFLLPKNVFQSIA